MAVSEFSKHFDRKHGYTYEESEAKKAKVDDAHEVRSLHSHWRPAEIVPDPKKEDGYMVVIRTL